MRRARLLIYDGPEEWLEAMRQREFITPEKPYLCAGGIIASVEIEAGELTLLECPDSVARIAVRGKVVTK